MEDSIYTKIIKGEIPCTKVYEDDNTLAFVDIYPIQTGMVLVVSKQQVNHFFDLDDVMYQALMSTVKKVARAIKQAFPDKARVGVMIEGFEVSHAHVKVFPVNSGDEFRAEPDDSQPLSSELQASLAQKLSPYLDGVVN